MLRQCLTTIVAIALAAAATAGAYADSAADTLVEFASAVDVLSASIGFRPWPTQPLEVQPAMCAPHGNGGRTKGPNRR
jgi:hypothetical protein